MKKIVMIAAVSALLFSLTGCGSLRTPASGRNHGLTYYNTFFGISIESLVYGDGLVVNAMDNK
ncbi:MAG: hypothetical protein WC959_07710 [Kiritimatiellales bacterium]